MENNMMKIAERVYKLVNQQELITEDTELNDTDKKLHISDVMCWFGLHKWNYKSDNGIERKCKRCAKQQKRTVLLKGTGSDFDNVERWKTNT